MKYIEQLKLARKENINITKLFVAYELDVLLQDYNKDVKEEVFEELCSIIYEYYLRIDYSSINDVARIVYNSFKENENIENIEEAMIREELENMYL